MSINVNKPKFFINELQYQDSIGNIEMGYVSRGRATLNAPVIVPLPIYNHPEKSFTREAGGEPYPYHNPMHLVIGLKDGYFNDLLLPEEEDQSNSSRYGSYLAFLGHNFDSGNKISIVTSQENFGDVINSFSEFEWQPSQVPFHEDTLKGYGDNMTVENVINWSSDADSLQTFEMN